MNGNTSRELCEAALRKLQAGNQRFVKDERTYPNTSVERLSELAKGQNPYVTILTCSDSRIPVEHIFDAGLGEIFTIRVAGNVCGIHEVASIEFSVLQLQVPLVVILGHTRCGAVSALVQQAEVPGNIHKLLESIHPAAERVKANHAMDDVNDFIHRVIHENVWNSIESLFQNSPVICEAVRNSQVEVTGAVVDITTGTVEWMGEHPNQQKLIWW